MTVLAFVGPLYYPGGGFSDFAGFASDVDAGKLLVDKIMSTEDNAWGEVVWLTLGETIGVLSIWRRNDGGEEWRLIPSEDWIEESNWLLRDKGRDE